MAVKKVGQEKKKVRKATCGNCAAKLEFLPKDVKYQGLTSMCESDGGYNYIVCPECKQQVEVK